MNEQKKLFRQIQVYSFAVYEAALYLDGHPTDRKGMDYYRKYNMKLSEAKERYERKYGPLTIYGVEDDCKWMWTASPWPWEYDSI